jgi:hypothetical protein
LTSALLGVEWSASRACKPDVDVMKKRLFLLLGVELHFLSHPACNVITIATELPRVPVPRTLPAMLSPGNRATMPIQVFKLTLHERLSHLLILLLKFRDTGPLYPSLRPQMQVKRFTFNTLHDSVIPQICINCLGKFKHMMGLQKSEGPGQLTTLRVG